MDMFDDQNAPIQAPNTHHIMKQTVLLMLALMGGIFLSALFALLNTENNLAQNTHQQTLLLLNKALDNRQEKLRLQLADNADRNEAWDNLHQQVNLHWAWDEQNLGTSLYTKYGYEGVFVLSPEGQTRYSVVEGHYQITPFEKWLGTDVTADLNNALAQSNGNAVSRLRFTQDHVVLVAAAWITTEDKNAMALAPATHSMMIFVDILTPQKLHELGSEYAIRDLHAATYMPQRPVADNMGMVLSIGANQVYFSWNNKNPADALLTWVLPLLLLLMITAVFFALNLARKALFKARLNDDKNRFLEHARQELSTSERRFRDVVEATTDWIWEADEHLKLTWISAQFRTVTGHRADDWLGRSFHAFLGQDNPTLVQWLERLPQPGNLLTLSHCHYLSAEGVQRYCNLTLKKVVMIDGSQGFRGTATDVTEEVERSERIQYLSHHDELTGLPNRARMKEFLETRFAPGKTAGHPLAMISLDLNNFKSINDVYGHNAGDKVLCEVSLRLRRCIRNTDLVARQGGDEFIIIVVDIYQHSDIEIFCQRIVNEMNRPFIVCDNELSVGASMGVALAPKDANTASDLLRYSDMALYKAKNYAQSHWCFYQPDMTQQVVQRRQLEKELRNAIKTNQLFLIYQPQYDLHKQKIVSLEALVRWQHPKHGLLMPDQFIPLAEETGIIIALTDWVLATACRDIGRRFDDIAVSVNISPIEFKASDIVSRIRSALDITGFAASRLEIEVTETATRSRPEYILTLMQQLKSLGVKLFMDDFGTGFASLNYLRTFPFDGIKLDKSFIFSMADSEISKNIVEKIIGLGKDLNLTVIAEGVETEEQLHQLQHFHCDVAVGYFIGRPVPLEKIILN